MTAMRRLLFCFILLLPAADLRAQSVRWDPPGGTLAASQVVQLGLVFDQYEPSAEVALPKIPGLEFGAPGRAEASSIRFDNGRATTTRTITLTYPMRAAAGLSAVEIPAFDVDTKQGRQRVPAASFTVGPATVGGNGASNVSGGGSVPLDSVAQSRFTTPRTVWAGEVFPLVYSLDILERYYYQLGSNPDWKPAPLLIEEDWAKTTNPAQARATRGGESHLVTTYQTRAYTKSPGDLTLNPATQLAVLQTGVQNFGLFAQRTVDRYAITTAPATLTVRPLPVPAPAEFTGAVGDFTFEANVVPATAAVGEPVTWTLTLSGTGNWPDLTALPPRNVSRDFRIVAPPAKHTPAEGKLFEATLAQDIVLIPTKPGTYTLPPVTFACFDPGTGAYKTLTTKKFTVTVTGPASAPDNSGKAEPGSTGQETGKPAAALAVSTPPPTGLLRDPLPPATPAATPLTTLTFVFWLLPPILGLLCLWFALALRRAHTTDPLRPQRAARQRLATLLSELATADREQTEALLRAWRLDTAALFGLTTAEPTATALTNGNTTSPLNTTDDWQALWADTDRALFGEKKSLPADWLPRAEAALEARRIPGFSPFRLFLPRNFFPAAVLVLVFFSPFSPFPPPARAADPASTSETQNSKPRAQALTAGAAAYAAADFPTAEKSWRAVLATAQTDWAAHYNLALALAQQSRWPESAGHALAAFVQQPQNPAIRWHLDLALKNAGFTPDSARPFLAAGPVAELATRASPTQWQRLAVLAAFLAAAAFVLLLLRAYGARIRWLKPAVWTVLLAALLLAVAATLSLRLYGPLADGRAVLVWHAGVLRSIPTEADTGQKTTPLAAGLVAVADKNFLEGRWVRLVFPNGQTGWVRPAELVSLW